MESGEKLCSKCRQMKATGDFAKHKRNSDGLQVWCRICKRANDAEYYQQNKEKYLEYNRERYARVNKLLSEIKNNPCSDCGGSFPPYVMDFDHLDASEKLYNVGNARKYGLGKMMLEIAKCELVCANCHRIRTHNRDQERKTSSIVLGRLRTPDFQSGVSSV